MKRILLFFALCASMSAPLLGVNGENRAKLRETILTVYKLCRETPKEPKRVIVVPRYSLTHSFKLDAREITKALKAPMQFLAFALAAMYPKNRLVEKLTTILNKHALLLTGGALTAFTLFMLYKTFFDDDEHRQYATMSITIPSALTVTYLIHKWLQYMRFKEKYRLLIAANT